MTSSKDDSDSKPTFRTEEGASGVSGVSDALKDALKDAPKDALKDAIKGSSKASLNPSLDPSLDPFSGGRMSAEEALIAQVAAEVERGSKRGEEESGDAGEGAREGARDGAGEGDVKEREEEEMTHEAQIANLSDRLSRSLAEVENMRRRFERERRDALRYGAGRLASDIFEVGDNLRRARSFISAEAMARDAGLKNFVVGIEMTERLLEDALRRHEIVVIDPNIGSVFSASEHEAVSEVESSEVGMGCVVEVVLRGYRMGERLLRPAQVITAKRGVAETETTEETEKMSEKTEEKKG